MKYIPLRIAAACLTPLLVLNPNHAHAAPAAAAEKLCTTTKFTPELGGTKRSIRDISKLHGYVE